MNRQVYAAAALLLISVAGNARAQEAATTLPAVDFETILAQQASKSNLADELPDLNLGGYRSSAWGQPVAPALLDEKTASIMGQPVERATGVDQHGTVRSVRWRSGSASLAPTMMLDRLVARYGTPSVLRAGKVEEAIWIGAASTLTYRREGQDWSLVLVPTIRR